MAGRVEGEKPDALLRRVGQALQQATAALAAHWIFGGTEDTEGTAAIMLAPGAGAPGPWTVQVCNQAADRAIITLAPTVAEPAGTASGLESALLLTAEEGGLMYYVLRLEDERPCQASAGLLDLLQVDLPTLQAADDLWQGRLLPDSVPLVAAVRRTARQTGRGHGIYRLQDAQGNIRTLSDQVCVLARHEPPVLVGIVRDQSPLFLLDDHAKAQWQAIEQSREGFAFTDREGAFRYMNREHLELFGFTDLSQVLGRPWRILYQPEEADRMEREVMPVLFSRKRWHGHIKARRQDGTLFNEDLTLSLLPDGGIACNCRDRTQELEMQERLSRNEELFRGFTDNAPIGVFIKHVDGRLHFANRLAAAFLGLTPDELVGRIDRDIMPADLMNTAFETDHQVVATARPVTMELTTRRGGSEYHLEVVKFPLCDRQGRVEYICSIYIDVTRRRQLEREAARVTEQQAELLGMQREFISLVSHEFRTPLASIQGAHYLLERRLGAAADATTRRYLELQGQSIASMRDLADQVLSLNRLEHQPALLKLKPVAVAELLDGIVNHFNGLRPESAPRIALAVDLPAGFTIAAEPAMLRVALENLIGNAIKFSPPEGPITVSAAQANEQLVLGVTDEGRGIPEADRASLFKPFFRGGNAGNVPGTGLGLAIVRRAVTFHHGQVDFQSAEGRGSTFRLRLPLNPVPTT